MSQSYTATIAPFGISFSVRSDQTLLAAMERAGLRHVCIGCRRGGCGVCKVVVLTGEYNSQKMSRDHVSANDEVSGIVLACCIEPRSDITFSLIDEGGESTKRS